MSADNSRFDIAFVEIYDMMEAVKTLEATIELLEIQIDKFSTEFRSHKEAFSAIKLEITSDLIPRRDQARHPKSKRWMMSLNTYAVAFKDLERRIKLINQKPKENEEDGETELAIEREHAKERQIKQLMDSMRLANNADSSVSTVSDTYVAYKHRSKELNLKVKELYEMLTDLLGDIDDMKLEIGGLIDMLKH